MEAQDSKTKLMRGPNLRQRQEEEPCFDWGCCYLTFLMSLVMLVTLLGVYTFYQGWGWWEDYLHGFGNTDLVHAVKDMSDFYVTIDVSGLVVILHHQTGCPFTANAVPILEDLAVRYKGVATFLTINVDNVDLSLADFAPPVTYVPVFNILCQGDVYAQLSGEEADQLEEKILELDAGCRQRTNEFPGVFGGS
uniref:Thioredoxin domain-containing protein n=2 Tax=Amorphochlora amoebiformis TaxID=1561963 RepID=A0A7S0DRJ2_9EUKA